MKERGVKGEEEEGRGVEKCEMQPLLVVREN